MLRSGRRHATVSAAAAACLALLGACGAAAGGPTAAPVAAASSPASAAVHGPAGAATDSPATPPPSAGQPGAVRPPAVPPALSPARHVTRPLALPAASASTGGQVTGVVGLGPNRCLFLTTDAGQRFEITGSVALQLRTVLTAGVGGPLTAPTASPPRAVPLPGLHVRIAAVGTVSAGPSVCGARYLFTARSGSVEPTTGAGNPTAVVASAAVGAPGD